MSTLDNLRNEIKKLASRAGALKLDLHDLSEDLPQNWQKIMEVAQRTYDAYAELDRKKAELAVAE